MVDAEALREKRWMDIEVKQGRDRLIESDTETKRGRRTRQLGKERGTEMYGQRREVGGWMAACVFAVGSVSCCIEPCRCLININEV